MTIRTYMLKQMMRSYDRQIDQGHRLESIQKYLAPFTQKGTHQANDSQDTTSLQKHDQLVEQISREIIDNLIASGSTNPVVGEIREQLNQEFPDRLLFSYGIPDNELNIVHIEGTASTTLSPEERDKVMVRIWEITREKVGSTIICP
ncbi:MAG: hypothetical protein CSA21_04755 [Deltaproteobacteria bacterium]|nr:MAG: hypothetical protein CSA21_04755 [Deltaproteobacteria bacterium]